MLVTVGTGGQRNILSTELSRRERHTTEYATRIVLFNGNAFLFGDAVLGCLNEILCGAHDANYREDAERYSEITLPTSSLSATDTTERKGGFKAREHRLGKVTLAAATAAVALTDAFYDACSEKNGRDNLNDCRRLVLFVAFVGITTTEIVACYAVALENADVALAAIKDDAFFKHGNALDLLRASCTDASFKYKLYVKTNVDRVKSAVKANGLDIDTRPNDFCTLGANGACMLQNLVAKFRKIYACIFKAIAVAAGIENATGVNAYGLTCRGTARHARKFIFCHSQISLLNKFRELLSLLIFYAVRGEMTPDFSIFRPNQFLFAFL